MDADSVAELSDTYVRGRFALWAGDFQHGRDLLQAIAGKDIFPFEVEGGISTDDLVRFAAGRRLDQLRQRETEFQRIRDEFAEEFDREVEANPHLLRTTHLRGAIWRISEREFEMRAYLDDLRWEKAFQMKASKIKKLPTPARANLPIPERYSGIGATWVLGHDPFVEATISDLNLIHAYSFYTRRTLNLTVEQIEKPFLKVLRLLDDEK